jgi:thiol-disulfide isomerase/thioredoxin
VHTHSIFISILILFIFLGCEEKASKESIPVENTTEMLEKAHSKDAEKNRFKVHQKPISQENIESNKATPNDKTFHLTDSFTLSNLKKEKFTVTISNKKLTFKESTKHITLVTFFATWCPPCLYQIPYLNDLHKKYSKDLFLVGILIHDTITQGQLKSFIAKNQIYYYLSYNNQNNDFASLVAKTLHLSKDFAIPLTVMYVEGEYFTHYEGIVPIEMIEYDIQQAKKILK